MKFMAILLMVSLTFSCSIFETNKNTKKKKDPFRINPSEYSRAGEVNLIIMIDPAVSQQYLPELLAERIKDFLVSLSEHAHFNAFLTTPSLAEKGYPINQDTDLKRLEIVKMLKSMSNSAGPRLSKVLNLYHEGKSQKFFFDERDLFIFIISTKDDSHWSMPQVLGPLRETWPKDLQELMDLKDKLKSTHNELRLITFVPHGNCLDKWQLASRLMYASSLSFFGDIKGDEWKKAADSVDLCSLDFQQFFISINEEIKYRKK